jgi:hypothetical protein
MLLSKKTLVQIIFYLIQNIFQVRRGFLGDRFRC